MRGIFAVGDKGGTWTSVISTMRDPRVLVRGPETSFTRIPKPTEEVPITVVVPVARVDWTLWEVIFGLNFLQYQNVRVLFIVASPELNDKVVSIVKTYRDFLPENNIFTPKRLMTTYDILNVALSSITTDYFCLLMTPDHIHPSALASLSEAILKSEADFYHTLRYRSSVQNHMYCPEYAAPPDPWNTLVFGYRGLYTFKKSTVLTFGGFPAGTGLQDPAVAMIYELLNAEAKVEFIPEHLYISRISKQPHATRGPTGKEWRDQLIAACWPQRVKAAK